MMAYGGVRSRGGSPFEELPIASNRADGVEQGLNGQDGRRFFHIYVEGDSGPSCTPPLEDAPVRRGSPGRSVLSDRN